MNLTTRKITGTAVLGALTIVLTLISNYITIGTFVGTSLISIWAVLKTFKFDEDGTITSTLGRGILNGIIPKFKQK